MSVIETLEDWHKKNDSIWIDMLRMILGIVLMAKGALFMSNITSLHNNLQLYFGITGITPAFAIAGIHIAAGFLIFIGFALPFACLVQVPVLIAAIIFVNIYTTPAELISSLLVFFLLLFFTLKGSGRFSAYYFIANYRRVRPALAPISLTEATPLAAIVGEPGNLV